MVFFVFVRFLEQKKKADEDVTALKSEIQRLKENIHSFKVANVRQIDDGDARRTYYERILLETRNQLEVHFFQNHDYYLCYVSASNIF